MSSAPRLALAIAAGLLLAGRVPLEGTAERVLLGAVWLSALLAAVLRGGARSASRFAGAVALLGAFAAHPAAYVLGVVVLAIARAGRGDDAEPGPHDRALSLAAGLALVAPAALTMAVLAAGEAGRMELVRQLRSVVPANPADVAALAAWALAVWVSTCIAGPPPATARAGHRAFAAMALAGIGALAIARLRWIASMIGLPSETQWSEAPHLTNLLKLVRGQPLYGPLEDCNSYSYSPLHELLHRALLAPLGASLSLVANRRLDLVWHAATVAVLAWTFAGSFRRAPAYAVGCTVALALAATSSFLAPSTHPDHLTMAGFSLAILLVAAEDRLPRRLFLSLLVVVPAFCTAAKLTGAGVGLGLVLAFAVPFRPRELAFLAAGGVLALSTIPLFDATLGRFSAYAIVLQASHPIRWSMWHEAFHATPPGRAFLAALVATAAAYALHRTRPGGHAAPEGSGRAPALRAARLVLLTTGFLLPSMIAWLKLGGRENSLLPLTIGAASIFACLAPLVPVGARPWIAGPAALALLLQVARVETPVDAKARAQVERRFQETVRLVRRELERGEPTLLYDGMAAWIAAGGREVPLDRWPSVGELLLGNHPEVSAFYERLKSGRYHAVILGAHVLSPRFSDNADVLRGILDAHYDLEPTGPPEGDEGWPLLYRYRKTPPPP